MEIGETFRAASRDEWRAWLAQNHATARAIWLLLPRQSAGTPALSYLDAVEESLCFGWIDGIAKKFDADHTAQRFSPRRRNSHWTELNKERARRLIAAGLMTDAGMACLPDLSPHSFVIPDDILAALRANPETWENFERFPPLYQRVRIGSIEDARGQPQLFQDRLAKFLLKTKCNEMFGRWSR